MSGLQGIRTARHRLDSAGSPLLRALPDYQRQFQEHLLQATARHEASQQRWVQHAMLRCLPCTMRGMSNGLLSCCFWNAGNCLQCLPKSPTAAPCPLNAHPQHGHLHTAGERAGGAGAVH